MLGIFGRSNDALFSEGERRVASFDSRASAGWGEVELSDFVAKMHS